MTIRICRSSSRFHDATVQVELCLGTAWMSIVVDEALEESSAGFLSGAQTWNIATFEYIATHVAIATDSPPHPEAAPFVTATASESVTSSRASLPSALDVGSTFCTPSLQKGAGRLSAVRRRDRIANVLILKALLLFALFFSPSIAMGAQPSQGEQLYTQRCSSCHAANLAGGKNGPSLIGVGQAALDFWMRTGRMPAAVPWIEVGTQRPHLSDDQIIAIEHYVAQTTSTGPAIPMVSLHGMPEAGKQLFTQNCEHCHGPLGHGASIGGIEFAPSLVATMPVQIGEAIRTGPEQMPAFSEAQLSPSDVNDIATYISILHTNSEELSAPLATSGPVPEGLVGWIAAGLLAFSGVILWLR